MACANPDAVAAASNMNVSASESISTYSPAVSSQCRGTVSTHSSVQHAAVKCTQTSVVINKESSYLSILEQLCYELGLSPPTVEVSKKPAACTATLSVKYGFLSLKSHAKKADAQEDAARVALSGIKAHVKNAKNCKSQLNEYCQQQQSEKPDYDSSDSAPFKCTVFVPIVHKSLDLPTEQEAKNDAARRILTRLGHVSNVLKMFDEPRFEHFSVSRSAHSAFTLTARYRFTRPDVGERSKKNADKIAAERALAVLYPDLDPKPSLDKCKNVLQEQYPQEKPNYDSVSQDDGLFYSEVSVTFLEQMSVDNGSSLGVANDLAERACIRLGLIS